MECDVLLVCIGRRPYLENLGLEVKSMEITSKIIFHLVTKLSTFIRSIEICICFVNSCIENIIFTCSFDQKA